MLRDPRPHVRTVDGLRVSAPAQMFVELASILNLVDLVVVGDNLVRTKEDDESKRRTYCSVRTRLSPTTTRSTRFRIEASSTNICAGAETRRPSTVRTSGRGLTEHRIPVTVRTIVHVHDFRVACGEFGVANVHSASLCKGRRSVLLVRPEGQVPCRVRRCTTPSEPLTPRLRPVGRTQPRPRRSRRSRAWRSPADRLTPAQARRTPPRIQSRCVRRACVPSVAECLLTSSRSASTPTTRSVSARSGPECWAERWSTTTTASRSFRATAPGSGSSSSRPRSRRPARTRCTSI